jgi:ribonuclease G
MSKELVISASRHETRVALLEDDQVVEVYHQRENEYSLAGSIHKGRVTRVLPGMQSAFVDIGLERDAFLYVSDFFEDNDEYDKIVTSVEEKVLKLDRPGAAPVAPAATAAPPPEAATVAEPSAAAPVTAASAGASAPTAGPVNDQRRSEDRGRNDDRRGGRRSRRRRGGPNKGGGRGLPDSKFYSPRGDAAPPASSEPAAAIETEPEREREAEQPDDFFVLPGESLAKYTGGDEASDLEEEQDVVTGVTVELPDEAEPEADNLTVEAAAEVEPAVAEPEPPAETPATLHEAPQEPVAEAPVSASPLVEAATEAAAEASVEVAATESAAVEAAAEVPAEEETLASAPVSDPDAQPLISDAGVDEELAEDVDLQPEDAAEPGEGEAGEPGEAEGGEAIVEEEGPEPARIPTSLTATLREQNPRYLHRVSRRMRRRGGRGGQMPDATRPPGQSAAPAQEPRPPQDRGQQRDVQAPREPRPERTDRPERTEKAERPERSERPDKAGQPSISDLLREGQEIIVQIAKEPLGQKGALITSHIALPGRFLVYMPTVDHIGVSRKIPSDEERSRLKRVLQTHRTGIPGGYIVRTAGEGRTEEELRADMMFLYNLWLDMRQKAERRPAPVLIHHDLNVVERVLRDQLTSSFKSIWVDTEEAYESILRFVQRFQPALVNRVKLYTRSNPIFEEFNITSELEKALRPKVWLKSGGYIVINQTEALVAVDINTGKFVGKSNRLEDTIVKTNTDAIKEIVRQIRLRDLGGIIVVDFIDMDERKNRQKVMQALEEAMRADRAPYKILQFNDFGLVAITRKRVKQSLERTLCTPCPYCEGGGYVKSPQTVVGEILQEAQKIAKAVEGKDVMLRVAPEVGKLLKSNQNSYLQELEEILGRTVIVKTDSLLHQE